jgi:hypothetical protein
LGCMIWLLIRRRAGLSRSIQPATLGLLRDP